MVRKIQAYYWFCVVVCRFLRQPYPFRRFRDIRSIVGVAWAAAWYGPEEEEASGG